MCVRIQLLSRPCLDTRRLPTWVYTLASLPVVPKIFKKSVLVVIYTCDCKKKNHEKRPQIRSKNHRFFAGSFIQTAGSLKGFEITRIGGYASLTPPRNRTAGSLNLQRATQHWSGSGSGSRWMWLVVDHSESNSLQNYLTNS